MYRQAVENFYLIAHRGARALRPENSMSAFKKAYELGVDMIELDVQLTKDRVPVVFHDSTLDRLTNASGKVNRYTFSDLQSIDAGSRFHKSFAGTRIPPLNEVLQWATGKISLNIEIKKEAVENDLSGLSDGGIEKIVADMVSKYNMQHHVVISSFSYLAVSRIKPLNSELSVGLLYNSESRPDRGKHPLELIRNYGADCFHCHWNELKSRWLLELTTQGIPVFIYTVNNKRRMKRLIKAGVTGIFTDRPDRLMEVLKEIRL